MIKNSNTFLHTNGTKSSLSALPGIKKPKADVSGMKSVGKTAKDKISSIVSKKYGELGTKHLFDGIADSDVEKNIPIAESTIQTNVDRGLLDRNKLAKLPNLRDGLALSYAAADVGNSKAATKAREAAYMESNEPWLKETGTRLMFNNSSSNSNPFADFVNGGKLPSLKERFSYDDVKKQGVAGKRFVRVKSGNLNMRTAPGIDNPAIDKMPRGTEVYFTGNKTSVGTKQWAEIEYGGKKGWVDAEYLKIDVPEDSVKTSSQKLNPLDIKQIQEGFNKFADFDNSGSLQCPDFSKWYIDEFTSLDWSGGNGNEQVAKTVSKNNLGKESVVKNPHLVTFPALYSVDGHKKLLGASGTAKEGHTGIIIGKTKNEKGEELFIVLHTWNGCNKDGYNSSIGKYVIPQEGVTYLNLSPYLK